MEVNVQDFGALGNGTNPDDTAIQNAINAANAGGGGVVFFPAGTYKLTKALKGFTRIHLKGSTEDTTVLDFTSFKDEGPVLVTDGSVGPALNVSEDVERGAESIKINELLSPTVSGVVSGDRLLLGSKEPFRGLFVGPNWFGTRGEIVIVKSRAGNTVRLFSPTFDSYANDDGAQVQKLDLVEDAGIEDLTIRRENQAAKSRWGVSYSYCERLRFRNVRFQHCTESAIRILNGLSCVSTRLLI